MGWDNHLGMEENAPGSDNMEKTMKPRYTKGPWKCTDYGRIEAGSHGRHIADAFGIDKLHNARLIAQAPNLLETAEVLLEATKGSADNLKIAIATMEFVIKKAKGELV